MPQAAIGQTRAHRHAHDVGTARCWQSISGRRADDRSAFEGQQEQGTRIRGVRNQSSRQGGGRVKHTKGSLPQLQGPSYRLASAFWEALHGLLFIELVMTATLEGVGGPVVTQTCTTAHSCEPNIMYGPAGPAYMVRSFRGLMNWHELETIGVFTMTLQDIPWGSHPIRREVTPAV